MFRHKSHIQVEQGRLYSHKFNEEVFTPNRHDCLYLSDILIRNSRLRSNQLSAGQRVALDLFCERKVFDLRDINDGYLRTDVLQAYFIFFDKLFFFGSLHNRCQLHFKLFAGMRGGVGLNATTGKRQEECSLFERLLIGPKKQMFDITLYLDERESSRRYKELSSYIGTLLHEMIHAFLRCWACDHRHCTDADGRLGRGHGFIWQEVAFALECAARDPTFLNLSIRLARVNSLATELAQTGRPIGEMDLARWNISEGALRDRYATIQGIGGSVAIEKIING